MLKRVLFFLVLIFLFTRCGSDEKELPKPDVYEIRDIGVLSTTEYTIGKIVKLNDPPEEWYKYGERKILISCKAKVKAGVDLSKLKDGDIVVSGNTVEITLPPAEITTFTMDPKMVRTEMESITGFRDRFTQKDKNNFLRQGEKAIREDLKGTNILKDAERDARKYLKEFYKRMGFEEVIVKHKQNEENG